ncbi:hypothetical protein TNCV_3291121 [Trichonephila clavipes]|nr:hypothetical protein TNCV_3291121 [Trichonephila clavipes]
MDLEIAFQKKDCNKSSAMEGIHGQMIVNLSELGRGLRLDSFNTSWNCLGIQKKLSSSPLENTKRLMNPTVIDQSLLPTSRTNKLRGLSGVHFRLFLTSTI